MHSMKRIGQHFWYITPISETDRPILGMVVGNNKTLMIDAGNSENHANYFLKELEKENIHSPDMVVITHWHWDHIFGLSALSNALSISSKQTKMEMEKLIDLSWLDKDLDLRVYEGLEIEFCANAIKKEFSDDRNIKVVLPDITFEDRIEINLGGLTCVLQHVGGSHASDSVVVYLKEEKILFLADCIYSDIYAENRSYKIDETLHLLDKLETFDAETYVLSHWKPIVKEEFKKEVTMLREIANCTKLAKGDKEEIIEAYKKITGRELTEDEVEVINEFVNGYNCSVA
ncbi:MBL fold metallo-hydrolase [Niallia taxi]|uniref:MBL fold metallo-hydrolase n=1 Tax=Niallia taxi TaxID=2499688 RepID=UPI003981F22B